VRIALNLKGLAYDYLPVHLLKEGGQQLAPAYRALNPAGLVPTLVDGEVVIGQSLAIIEYLEETQPHPALLPTDAAGRARVRMLAQTIACDIHPLNNLRVLKYLKHGLHVDEPTKNAWYQHWVERGLTALEQMLAQSSYTGRYCHGDTPGLADVCLVPQIANACRFACNLDAMPTILRIDAACSVLPAFEQAAPAQQADAQ
jgi:maleylpyruvate isomerase